jgi:hypothetical protein
MAGSVLSRPSSPMLADTILPKAMIDKPASKSHWILLAGGNLVDSESGIGFGAYGSHEKYCFGQPTLLPTIFLNFMRPRCLDSSKKLRKLTLNQANELLEAGLRNHEAYKKKEDPANPDPERTIAANCCSKGPAESPAPFARWRRKIGSRCGRRNGGVAEPIKTSAARSQHTTSRVANV